MYLEYKSDKNKKSKTKYMKENFKMKVLWSWSWSWSCLIFLFIFLLFASASSAGSPESTTATPAVTTTDTDDMTTNSLPTAAKLVRFRRQPPITIIKHVIRSSKHSKPRRRIKRPKIRYGPPSYIYEEQSSYKPHYRPSKPPPETPTFSLDEFPGLNLNAADFELPSSSYETQSMELDFYGHDEEENSYHSKPKVHAPSTEYSGQEFEPSLEPTYSYKSVPRKPHQKYGVPKHTVEYSSNFKVNPDFFSSTDYSLFKAYQPESIGHSQSSSSQYQPTNTGKHSLSTSLVHVPDEQYNIQSHPFQTEQQSTYNVEHSGPDDYSLYNTKPSKHSEQQSTYNVETSRPDDYSLYNTKPSKHSEQQSTYNVETSRPDDYSLYNTKHSNSGYSQNYDVQHEPVPTTLPLPPPPPSLPRPHPTQPISEIEITYSPSYEINLPPPSHNNGDLRQYDSIDPHIQPGNFAEPPEQHPPISQYAPEQHIPIQPASGSGHVDYVPPSQELPLNPQYKQPAYDFPKSSYEVPIYDPIPFEASTNDEQEYYPPNQFEPHSIPPPPPSPPTTRLSQPHENNYESHFEQDQHQHQQRPPNDRTPQPSGDEIPTDTHTLETDASTKSTTKLRRNRKRQRRPFISSTKHILDVPELKEAFEAARPTKYDNTINADTEVNASSYVEEKQKMAITKPNKSTENYYSQEWNPMRIRTIHMAASKDVSTPIATSRSIMISSNQSNKPEQTKPTRSQIRPRLRPLATVSTISSPSMMPISGERQPAKKTASVSIEKSQSKSYYDGTLAPSTLTMSDIHNSRLNKFNAPTRLPVPVSKQTPTVSPSTQNPYKDATTSKRTTKSIFDTTHFKAPQNRDWGDGTQHPSFGQDLPKNHKFY